MSPDSSMQAESHQHHSTWTLLMRIWLHLRHKRRMQLLLLICFMLLTGVAELIILGSILPLLAFFSDPQLFWQDHKVRIFAGFFGITSTESFLIPAILFFVLAVVFATLIRLASLWLNGRIAASVGSDISCDCYERTLYQPYSVHISRNSSELIAKMTTHVDMTVIALNAFLQLIISSIICLGIFIGLLMISPKISLVTALVFGLIYYLLAILSRKELLSNGEKISLATKIQLKSIQEGLGAIREVLLNQTQTTYLATYTLADEPRRRLSAKNLFIRSFPRYALEAFGLVAIATLGGILLTFDGLTASIIPLLGALALGAQRLLPALQQIFNSWAALKSYNSSLSNVLSLLDQTTSVFSDPLQPLKFTDSISLHGVCFAYDAKQHPLFDGLDLKIMPGECVGIIGETGSGKSTMLDLMMGLLEPTKGKLLVDDIDVNECPKLLNAWRNTIAHVPQSIYLSDSTIAENIAFGLPLSKIDYHRVELVSKQAHISGFIQTLPNGYGTLVGERGVRLSGGQRQRIGIARALYKQSNKVLFLDEATSALDIDTEKKVIAEIHNLNKDLTTIMIAHRLSTIRNCDRVIRLSRGSISADGPPEQVLKSAILKF